MAPPLPYRLLMLAVLVGPAAVGCGNQDTPPTFVEPPQAVDPAGESEAKKADDDRTTRGPAESRQLQAAQVLESPSARNSFQVRWGDIDGDGRLELASANHEAPNEVYGIGSDGLVLLWSSPESEPSQAVAWGDFDGDGDDDLAVANMGSPNRVYRSDERGLTPLWSSPQAARSKDVEWADIDADGDLDLVFVGVGPTLILRNEGGQLQAETPVESASETDAIAVVDLNGDGQPHWIFANSGPEPQRDELSNDGTKPRPFGPSERTSSVAWLRAPDGASSYLALARPEGRDAIYRLDESSLRALLATGALPTPVWVQTNSGHSREVRSIPRSEGQEPGFVWAVEGRISMVELKNGSFVVRWTSPQEGLTEGVAVADANGDGWLDLAVGNRNIAGKGPGPLPALEPIRVHLHVSSSPSSGGND